MESVVTGGNRESSVGPKASTPAQTLASHNTFAVEQIVNLRWLFGIFSIFLLLTLLVQWLSGAYYAGLSGYPDEPAHFVSGLMVREYILNGHDFRPLQFAEWYYLHYPKVAIGHWPPVFYVLETTWMLLFAATKEAVLVLMAIVTAGLAVVTAWEVARRNGAGFGLGAGLLILSLPSVQSQTTMIMVDTMMALTALIAGVSLISLLETPNWKNGLKLGISISLVILTKGGGWAFAFVVPAALILSRRLSLLRAPAFLLALLVIGIACVPWQLFTLKMARAGWEADPSVGYFLDALLRVSAELIRMGGIPLAILALVPFLKTWFGPRQESRTLQPFLAVHAAMIAGTIVFHAVVPSGVESRKLLMALPSVIVLAASGLRSLSWMLPDMFGRRAIQVIGGAALLVYGIGQMSLPVKRVTSFSVIASRLLESGQPHEAILISSDAQGEGELIAELAARRPTPDFFTVRATKLLADMEWSGRDYQSYFQTVSQVRQLLDEIPINAVVVQNGLQSDQWPHHMLLSKAIAESPEWKLSLRTLLAPGEPGTVLLYNRVLPIAKQGRAEDEIRRRVKVRLMPAIESN